MDNILNNDSFANEINEIVNNNLLYRFKKELEFTYDSDKKDMIKLILKNYTKDSQKLEYDTKQMNKSKLDSFLDKMTNNKFKQTWTRLNYEQKITKFEEFIQEYNFTTKVNKKKLILKLKALLDADKLNTSKEVIYDKENCKIDSIKDFENIVKDI